MNIRMNRGRKKITLFAALLLAAGLLTGCGNRIPDMTEEEMDLVTSYAAVLVAQYSPDYQTRLIDTEKEAERRAEIAEKAAKVQELIDAQKQAEEAERAEAKENLDSTPVIGGNGAGAGTALAGMEELADYLQQDGFSFSYEGYDITKSYPPEDSDEWTPTIDASRGKSLLILHFGVTNELDSSNRIDLISQDVLFHIETDAGNGSAIATLLLDDLSYANEEIAAHEKRSYVLVTQIDDGIAAVNEVKMRVKNGGESIVVKVL